MKVSSSEPFQIVYSIFQHEYLGYLMDSFVVHVNEMGKLTFKHQNISSKNAKEFSSGADEIDFELINILDSMHQTAIVSHFSKKQVKPEEFFLKVYDKNKGSEEVQTEINNYLESRKSKALKLMKGKAFYEMGNDGFPAWRKIIWPEEKASVLFHFYKNEDNTHYFPTIKYKGEKLDWQYKGGILICNNPAWLLIEDKLYQFENGVDGKKLKPFLNKKFIVIPKPMEDVYFKKFVAPLMASFDVSANGFNVYNQKVKPTPELSFCEINNNVNSENAENKILFELNFQYGDFQIKGDQSNSVSVKVKKEDSNYSFHRILRSPGAEKGAINFLEASGLKLIEAKSLKSQSEAFDWLNQTLPDLKEFGIEVKQLQVNGKKYFLGEARLEIKIEENIDWFDINAIVKFGEFEISFKELRNLMIKNKREIKLPNGEIAIIPETWFKNYSTFITFAEEDPEKFKPVLKKHHLALVEDLSEGSLIQVNISEKLKKLKDLTDIDASTMPNKFSGELRPYQKAGYDWLAFLNQYKFGGCLADDMGLGKTIQTLAMLQSEKEKGASNSSLIIMPTSLIYNWEKEINKFTPELKALVYSGTSREKNVENFQTYNVILTSYGIVRLDFEILKEYYFNYIILDESQIIKNPSSNIAKAVRELPSRNKLILTGTPVENSTLDLWSQLSFINPGLLGTQAFFKKEFLIPIEKKKDELKSKRLHSLIKPFIMRRLKSQVVKELPEKVEKIQYTEMAADQKDFYEEIRSTYRNKILDNISSKGLGSSKPLLLQGLTQLRQIANHPKMVDQNYQGDSGKLSDVMSMLGDIIIENHKVLIFSQFVKHLSIVKSALKENKIDFSYLDGATKNRAEVVEEFQSDFNKQLFLISLKAGGLGLNLTQADYVFILDPWWNPAVEAQAIDRAHRIGQKNKVFTYKFISKDSVEEKILSLQEKKLKLATDLISTDEGFIKKLTTEDIENILS